MWSSLWSKWRQPRPTYLPCPPQAHGGPVRPNGRFLCSMYSWCGSRLSARYWRRQSYGQLGLRCCCDLSSLRVLLLFSAKYWYLCRWSSSFRLIVWDHHFNETSAASVRFSPYYSSMIPMPTSLHLLIITTMMTRASRTVCSTVDNGMGATNYVNEVWVLNFHYYYLSYYTQHTHTLHFDFYPRSKTQASIPMKTTTKQRVWEE